MTEEQQRIAIAEACGWSYEKNETYAPDGAFWWSKNPEFPDYLNDLNAMHSAVASQNVSFQQEFHNALLSLPKFPHQATSMQWAEIFVDIALRSGIIKP